ncbi:hypothetical protein [Alloactinosynnema sp. L-07]|uniref:hypothetical protein n=1 Tax=Alloactinosynnema sp. L-07 TaxID=1653480 RepID=UPI00065EF91D|nr:hypothetical protein [Alloactinosynnema sp. L-07]CRK61694.1 hypothetical protein [Alloactinosynnema sp. L-07]
MTTAHISEGDALARFPELAELVILRRRGWTFHPLGQHDDLIGIAATLSRRQYTDALFVFDRRHIVASRIVNDDHGGGIVWVKDGSDLTELTRDLLALPPPDAPGAPSLLIRTKSLWTP